MTYQLVGLVLFVLGISHIFSFVQAIDRRSVMRIQKQFARQPFLGWFDELWFFGRTPFTIVVLAFLLGSNWKLGLSALAVFSVMAGLEKLIKITFNRFRPYAKQPDIQMLQPQEPLDPSFPSGDALRSWYLALILSTAAGGSPVFSLLCLTVAVLVSLGRMVFGVHYLTDVLSGAGLGILGAGTTIWLWHIFHLL